MTSFAVVERFASRVPPGAASIGAMRSSGLYVFAHPNSELDA
jgi:hypothetical protein